MADMWSDLPGLWFRIGLVAKGVIVTLALMSMASFAIVLERLWTFRQARRQSCRYAPEVARLLKQGKWHAAIETSTGAAVRDSHLAPVLAAGLVEWAEQAGRPADPDTALDATREALRHAAVEALAALRRRLPSLATIGSTAPFVGLFGTTFGIINCFASMGLTGASGLGAISAGISEALITPAFGLFVAIPALWAYNSFLARVEQMGLEIDRTSHELVSFLRKQRA